MSGICSRHSHQETGCKLCHATPAMIFGIDEEEWEDLVKEAEKAGLAPCYHCGFEQYRNHPYCVKCGVKGWTHATLLEAMFHAAAVEDLSKTTTDEINSDPEEVDKLTKSRQQARDGKTIPLSEMPE